MFVPPRLHGGSWKRATRRRHRGTSLHRRSDRLPARRTDVGEEVAEWAERIAAFALIMLGAILVIQQVV
jgi:hypothetical protein